MRIGFNLVMLLSVIYGDKLKNFRIMFEDIKRLLLSGRYKNRVLC